MAALILPYSLYSLSTKTTLHSQSKSKSKSISRNPSRRKISCIGWVSLIIFPIFVWPSACCNFLFYWITGPRWSAGHAARRPHSPAGVQETAREGCRCERGLWAAAQGGERAPTSSPRSNFYLLSFPPSPLCSFCKLTWFETEWLGTGRARHGRGAGGVFPWYGCTGARVRGLPVEA